MLIDGRAAAHGRVDVGDGNQHPGGAASEGLRAGELVQVARVVIVDGNPLGSAQVPRLRVGRCARQGRGLRLRRS